MGKYMYAAPEPGSAVPLSLVPVRPVAPHQTEAGASNCDTRAMEIAWFCVGPPIQKFFDRLQRKRSRYVGLGSDARIWSGIECVTHNP